MSRITNEVKKKVVREHMQDGRKLNSLAVEYQVSHATITGYIHIGIHQIQHLKIVIK